MLWAQSTTWVISGLSQLKAPKTRKTLEETRKGWQEEKHLQLQNISRQKETTEKKHQREAYAAKKSVSTSKASVPSMSLTAAQLQEKRTASAQHVANSHSSSKRCTSGPSQPVLLCGLKSWMQVSELWAHLKCAVNNWLGICSPNSKKKMDFDQNIAASFWEQLGKWSHRWNHKDLWLKQTLAMAVTLRNKAAAHYLGVSKKMRLKVLRESNNIGWEDNRNARKDAVCKETAKEMVTFFNDADITRALPDARRMSVQNGKVQSRKVLQ